MINIDININSDFINQIELKGHAGSDDIGFDLVCCSVSTLIISLVNGLKEYVQAKTKIKLESGYCLLKIEDNDKNKMMLADVLTKTFLLSVKSLEEENPEFVKVNIMEEQND